MLPALTTKPKQAIRQVQGLTNDSIDAYSNTPLGGGSARAYTDNTEFNGTARQSPPATSRSPTSGHPTVRNDVEDGDGYLARVVRDRKASGEEELSLRTGDVVKVLSSKRTGYLKCEAGDEVGYVPSSYLVFLDENGEAEGGEGDETQRTHDKQQRKKHRKEKRRHKEKREGHEASDMDEAVPVSSRSPRKEGGADDEAESPRKSKKKHRKHRAEVEEGCAVVATPRDDEPLLSTRSRGAPEDGVERSKKSKHSSKKKRHHDVDTSESSDSDDGKRSHRHGRSRHRRRRGGRGASDSESSSSSSDDSDDSFRRRRRRRRRRKRRSSSEEDSDSDYKRRGRHSKKRRDKGESDPDDGGSRSARKAEKKRQAAAVQEVEKGVARLDVKDEAVSGSESTASAVAATTSRDKKMETEHSDGSSGGRATSLSRQDTSRKDDEGRAGTSTSSSSQKQGGRGNLGKQIGDKMRSFLGGGKKQSNSNKNSSGILNACAGTVQGEEGWYEHGENERYYFVLLEGKWSLLYGPMTEDDFEVFSNRVLEQNRPVELPHTYLHKSGYFLTREMRVTREQ